MNPLIKKEIRLLLPAWIAAMLLAVVPMWVALWSYGQLQPRSYVLLALALGLILMGIASFGQEFSHGTFTLLLSQPIERRRLWFIKTTVLAAACISVLLIPIVSWEYSSFHLLLNRLIILAIAKYVGLTFLSAFTLLSSGLWATLLLRRISEAFWITLTAPLAVWVTLYAFHDFFHWSNRTDDYVVPAVFLLYSLAGFFWARRLFLHAQDLQWRGGVIAFSSRKRTPERTAIPSRPGRWFSALVWKELLLQQVNLLIAAVVLTLHLASLVIRQVHPDSDNSNLRGLLELVWALWLVMPLLIGSAAVAEERRVGVTDSQFCLPVSRRTQFFIKFSVGLILSLVLGGLMPLMVERGHDLNYYLLVVAAVIFFVSFYASTIARTTLQAIGLAMVLAFSIYSCEVASAANYLAFHQYQPNKIIGLELLKLFLGGPMLFLVLARLMYWNFKWLHPERKLILRNAVGILAAFASVSLLVPAVYFRAWEFLTPVEPRHGHARLNAPAQVRFVFTGGTVYALLPDGKLWSETVTFRPGGDRWAEWLAAVEPGHAKLIDGSNWARVTAGYSQALAIQTNGSLWNLQSNPYGTQNEPRLTQIGSDTNWSQVAGGITGFLILKSNGSLWLWGTNSINTTNGSDFSKALAEKLRLDLAVPPICVSQESNSTEVLTWGPVYQKLAMAIKNDGSIVELSFHSVGSLQRTNMDNSWRSFVSWGPGYSVGIKTNGELWFIGNTGTNGQNMPGKMQLGREARWEAVTLTYLGSILAVRDDGTLWKWPDFAQSANSNSSLVKPVRLGNHSDWITLSSTQEIPLALSADGNLWAWDEPSRFVWLVPPRKPVYLGNIFTAQ